MGDHISMELLKGCCCQAEAIGITAIEFGLFVAKTQSLPWQNRYYARVDASGSGSGSGSRIEYYYTANPTPPPTDVLDYTKSASYSWSAEVTAATTLEGGRHFVRFNPSWAAEEVLENNGTLAHEGTRESSLEITKESGYAEDYFGEPGGTDTEAIAVSAAGGANLLRNATWWWDYPSAAPLGSTSWSPDAPTETTTDTATTRTTNWSRDAESHAVFSGELPLYEGSSSASLSVENVWSDEITDAETLQKTADMVAEVLAEKSESWEDYYSFFPYAPLMPVEYTGAAVDVVRNGADVIQNVSLYTGAYRLLVSGGGAREAAVLVEWWFLADGDDAPDPVVWENWAGRVKLAARETGHGWGKVLVSEPLAAPCFAGAANGVPGAYFWRLRAVRLF